jgi:predicted DNA-binding mobile mystery protein A
MNDNDLLRVQQIEDAARPFRPLMDMPAPPGGWVRAIREALGMTNIQLAQRLGRKAPQNIDSLQRSEAEGTIQLNTLREMAKAMGCQLVYALVPVKPLDVMREERAMEVARAALGRASHSMKLEAQDISPQAEQRALDRQVAKLLAGSPKRLWD